MKKKILVAVSGGFDPIHIGHVRMIQEARKMGDELVVILNNDNWLRKKKKNIFMHQNERKEIIESIRGVDKVVLTSHSKNPKDMSVVNELLRIKPDIFANGGDRKNENDIPEVAACKSINCKLIFNVGKGGKIQSSSWLLAKYVDKLKPKNVRDVKKTLNELGIVLRDSKIKLPFELKLKTAQIMLRLMNRKSGFGLFVILGWQNKWNQFTDVPDAQQDIYDNHPHNILKQYKNHKHDIETTINFDGAILIDAGGNVVHSGVIVEGLRPKIVADKINPGKFSDLSEQFGFRMKAHSRHLSAITASYVFPGTTVMTVSEENDSFHVFENGRIVYRLLD